MAGDFTMDQKVKPSLKMSWFIFRLGIPGGQFLIFSEKNQCVDCFFSGNFSIIKFNYGYIILKFLWGLDGGDELIDRPSS
jgi:hypothetical protein